MSTRDDFNRMIAHRTAQALLAQVEAEQEARALRMPTEQDAIRVMFDAYQRLKELGWRDGRHMPTTGERHAGVQCGSTGIHAYTAEKPDGPFARTTYMVYDGDLWPSYAPPVLYRPWRDTDVQVELRIAAPIPEESREKSPTPPGDLPDKEMKNHG